MKNIFLLFTIVAATLTMSAQKNYTFDESRKIINNLSPDQKLIMLNQLINANDGMMDDVLNTVISGAPKTQVDQYVARFKPAAAPATPVEAPVVAVHNPNDGQDHSGHNHGTATTQQNTTVTQVEPAASFKFVDKSNGPLTTMAFEVLEYDFGKIKEGEVVNYTYKFTNTGAHPLIISDAKGSCGCTVPEWPREPIAPGASGEIKVTFNSTGKGSLEGLDQAKKVTLTANTDPTNTYLTIKGNVKKPQ